MKIRFGYDLIYAVPQPSPMVLMLHSQPNRLQRLIARDEMRVSPSIPLSFYTDGFGNTCTRLQAPAGNLRITADGILEDCGMPEAAHWSACEHAVQDLPPDTLQFLLASRYCETDLLMTEAWRLFGYLEPGWARVQAICDFVNRHVAFDYAFARPTKTALETFRERQGVCRDFAHLAISFCRCLNIPARYCTTYLGDIGVAAVDAPMDFAGCMEVYLGGGWHMFDPRNNARRIGRLVVARGRDAADVAISTAFGSPYLQQFLVWTDEISDAQADQLARDAHAPTAIRAA
jgi:transglutaminase-like putative cysteine protease